MKKALLLICLTIIFSSCTKAKSTNLNNENKPVVAVTIVPQKSIIHAIAKDDFFLLVMVPPGYSPESYEPTPRSLANFSKAKIYFSIGMANEKNRIIPSLSKETCFVDLQKEIETIYPPLYLDEHHHHDTNTTHHHMVDPHIWLSPKRAIEIVKISAAHLQALVDDPQKKREYATNANNLISQIQNIDNQISSIINAMPIKTFYVFHPAFGYFANEYGLQMVSLEKDGKEATAKHLALAAFEAKNMGIKKIFYQSEIDSQQTKAFAAEIGGKSIMLEPLSSDYPNSLLTIAKEIASSFNL